MGLTIFFLSVIEIAARGLPLDKSPFANVYNSGVAFQKIKETAALSCQPDIIVLGSSRILHPFLSNRFDARLADQGISLHSFNYAISGAKALMWRILLEEPLLQGKNKVVIICPWIPDFCRLYHAKGTQRFWSLKNSLPLLWQPFYYSSRTADLPKKVLERYPALQGVYNFTRRVKSVLTERGELANFVLVNQSRIFLNKGDIYNTINGYCKSVVEEKIPFIKFKRDEDGLLPESIPRQGAIDWEANALKKVREKRDSGDAEILKMKEPQEAPYDIAPLNIFFGAVRQYLRENENSKIVIVWLPFQDPYLSEYNEKGRAWYKNVFQEESRKSDRLYIFDMQEKAISSQYTINDFSDNGEHLTPTAGNRLEKHIVDFLTGKKII